MAETQEVTHHVCTTLEQFLELKGDGTELVKLTVGGDKFTAWDGDYLFLGIENGRSMFARKEDLHSSIINRISCDTKYLHFNSQAGIIPSNLYCEQEELASDFGAGYVLIREKLEQIGEWRCFC